MPPEEGAADAAPAALDAHPAGPPPNNDLEPPPNNNPADLPPAEECPPVKQSCFCGKKGKRKFSHSVQAVKDRKVHRERNNLPVAAAPHRAVPSPTARQPSRCVQRKKTISKLEHELACESRQRWSAESSGKEATVCHEHATKAIERQKTKIADLSEQIRASNTRTQSEKRRAGTLEKDKSP